MQLENNIQDKYIASGLSSIYHLRGKSIQQPNTAVWHYALFQFCDPFTDYFGRLLLLWKPSCLILKSLILPKPCGLPSDSSHCWIPLLVGLKNGRAQAEMGTACPKAPVKHPASNCQASRDKESQDPPEEKHDARFLGIS